jgi:hypothetical protein
MEQLRQLASRPDVSFEDKSRLHLLLGKPLHFIRWAQNNRQYISHEIAKEFKAIKVVKDPFYEFDCPDKIKSMVSIAASKIADKNHNHQRKSQDTYTFTQSEVDEMINTAISYVHSTDVDFTKRSNALRLLECLCLLTGRRKWEIYATLRMKSHPHSDYQAMVCGLAKSLQMAVNNDWYAIPLLAPISTIIIGLGRVRMAVIETGRYSGYSKMFPKMTHTSFRDIYASQCYIRREINKFNQDVSCSKMEWMANALRIMRKDYANHYCTMLITDESVHHGDVRLEEDMADPDGGSPVCEQQDPLRRGGQHPCESGLCDLERVQDGDEGSHEQSSSGAMEE